MTKYDDFFDFKDCENNIDHLDDFGFDFGFDFNSDGFNFEYPYTKYVADLEDSGYSDEKIAKEIKEMEKDLEWRFKFASIQYMESELHEKHEIHKALVGIMSQLHDLANNTTNLDHDLTNVSDTIAWHVGSVADKLGDED